ncbi:hypothetical protein EPR50_G00121070 [Perca flavescens]|uniref:Uncharacterized protein n=1 Tax=Perca flavescens TaxID=8167 RepID=A0A484CW89_PERFV|nr:hypothetical protein EPR50_G00121070 [Perca flavescens]
MNWNNTGNRLLSAIFPRPMAGGYNPQYPPGAVYPPQPWGAPGDMSTGIIIIIIMVIIMDIIMVIITIMAANPIMVTRKEAHVTGTPAAPAAATRTR